MSERGRFFDDLAGVAGGAMSALAGMREEVESTVRARVEELIRKLDLVRREDLDAATEMAARARAGQEMLEARVVALEAAVAALQARPSSSASAAASAQAGPAASPPPDAGMPPAPPIDTEAPRPGTPDLRAPKEAD